MNHGYRTFATVTRGRVLVPILNARTIAGFVSGKVAGRGAGDTQIHRRGQYADVARLRNAAMTAGAVVSR